MKRTMIIMITVCFLMVLSNLLSVTWEIRQDGTGDFTTISEGITAAQDGDTLLVYPGIYYENLNYQGKNITITSLYDGDQYDDSYIANTVIDGNHQGTAVMFNSGETRNAVLNGFTVRHGLGSFFLNNRWGGGVFIRNASPTISNCHIKHNRAFQAGGISILTSGNPFLKGNTIAYNHGVTTGGLITGGGALVEFCSLSLNSIYFNYGGRSIDLFIGSSGQSAVIIDTMTVLDPDRYFFVYMEDVPPDFTLTVNHGKLEPVAADLYVSPDGCDSNSGLSPADPLKTIALALVKIAPDSLQQRTIHLAEGIYSRSANGQLFPLAPRSFIDIVGAGKDNTIFDLEEETLAIYSYARPNLIFPCNDPDYFIRNYRLKNFTIANGGNPMGTHGRGAMYIYYNKNFTLENIDVYNCHTGNTDDVDQGCYVNIFWHCENIILKNLHIYDCSGSWAIRKSSTAGTSFNLYAENLRIRNQQPGSWNQWWEGGYGGGINLRARDIESEPLNATFVNLELSDNVIDLFDPMWGNRPYFSQLSIIFDSPGPVRIINATIGNNYTSSTHGGGIAIVGANTLELINSIVYGNSPHNIVIANEGSETNQVHISHSLIQGGISGIHGYGLPNTEIHWGEGNIDADPLWLGEVYPGYDGDYPYMLSEFSPARNAGTLDIPDFEFPEFDLAGNPRIYGSSIDMGAYEWNPDFTGIESEEMFDITKPHDYNLRNYPNPVVALQGMGPGRGVGTTISFILPDAGEAIVDIYNVKGQFVKRAFNAYAPAGEYSVLWNGTDEQGRVVATGFYVYKLRINGEMVATGRCTFIK